jgi:hypothetical protein
MTRAILWVSILVALQGCNFIRVTGAKLFGPSHRFVGLEVEQNGGEPAEINGGRTLTVDVVPVYTQAIAEKLHNLSVRDWFLESSNRRADYETMSYVLHYTPDRQWSLQAGPGGFVAAPDSSAAPRQSTRSQSSDNIQPSETEPDSSPAEASDDEPSHGFDATTRTLSIPRLDDQDRWLIEVVVFADYYGSDESINKITFVAADTFEMEPDGTKRILISQSKITEIN